MHTEEIEGVRVVFPFKPYEAQVESAAHILRCLKNAESGVIESPTGTGKSLSILCACLSWVEHEKRSGRKKRSEVDPEKEADSKEEENVIQKIYICTRTHKQIDQLVSQLRKTQFRPRISILASRTHLCINESISRETDKNTACRNLLKNGGGGCSYFGRKDLLLESIRNVFDVEELKEEGRLCKGCPYYAARKMEKGADIVFAPYSYLFDPMIRKNMELSIANAIIIVDEGHNVEDVCRSSGSLELSAKLCEIVLLELVTHAEQALFRASLTSSFSLLAAAMKGIKDYIDKYIGPQKEGAHKAALQQTLFESYAARGRQDASSKKPFHRGAHPPEKNPVVKKGPMIKDELIAMGITEEAFPKIKGAISELGGADILNSATLHLLDSLKFVLSILFSPKIQAYAMVLAGDTLSFICLDSAIVFSHIINEARSVVLLSGTLAPFDGIIRELGCGGASNGENKFKHRAEAPHVIEKEQLYSACITTAKSKQPLLGTFASLSSDTYLSEVGRVVSYIGKKLSGLGGVLCFVPSYVFLERLSGKIACDHMFTEPKGSNEQFEDTLARFRGAKKRGACIFLCVYRGRASEGIDFRDSEARAVVAVGIPFPNLGEPEVFLKREYNDQHMRRSGNAWYEMQAYKAVNQAVGRCIRHKEDWGAIFLVDSRYKQTRVRNMLSKWISKDLSVHEEVDCIGERFSAFIEHNSKNETKENVPPAPQAHSSARYVPPKRFSRYYDSGAIKRTKPSQ